MHTKAIKLTPDLDCNDQTQETFESISSNQAIATASWPRQANNSDLSWPNVTRAHTYRWNHSFIAHPLQPQLIDALWLNYSRDMPDMTTKELRNSTSLNWHYPYTQTTFHFQLRMHINLYYQRYFNIQNNRLNYFKLLCKKQFHSFIPQNNSSWEYTIEHNTYKVHIHFLLCSTHLSSAQPNDASEMRDRLIRHLLRCRLR